MRKRHSLLVQLMVYIFLLLSMTTAAVGYASYLINRSTIKQTTEENARDSVQQGKQFIHSYIQKLKQTSSGLAQNSSLLDYVSDPTEANRKQLEFIMDSVLLFDQDLLSGTLVTKTGQIVSTNPHLQMKTSSDMMKESWYRDAIYQKNMPVLTSARKENVAEGDEEWVISVTQEILDKNGENAGVLKLDINYQTLENYLDRLKLGEKGFTFIVNNRHEFVYHPVKKVYSSKEDMEQMIPFLEVRDGYTKDNLYFAYQVELAEEGWTLISVASLEQIQQLQERLLFSLLWAILPALIISALLAWLIVRHWIKPLRDLQKVILAIAGGERNVRAREVGSTEVLDLARQFNTMLNQIDHLVLSVRQQEKSVRQYELQALASQINPHFLYNTLDTIVWLAEFNDGDKVVEVTKALAKYFRLALNQGNEQITLKNELDHVRQYLAIQKIRYGEKLQYEIQELPAYAEYLLPKLVLQPIVENAIYHGIKNVNRQGLVSVRVTESEDSLIISVRDNGKGFPVKGEESTKNIFTKKGSVGLKNVDSRLSLQFKEFYHMELMSEADKYTDISLYLPKNPSRFY